MEEIVRWYQHSETNERTPQLPHFVIDSSPYLSARVPSTVLGYHLVGSLLFSCIPLLLVAPPRKLPLEIIWLPSHDNLIDMNFVPSTRHNTRRDASDVWLYYKFLLHYKPVHRREQLCCSFQNLVMLFKNISAPLIIHPPVFTAHHPQPKPSFLDHAKALYP